MKHIAALAAAALLGASAAAYAQSGHQGHAGHGSPASDSASTKAYRAANAKMHAGMDITFSGDADVDFVRGMISHHQGAIEMADQEVAQGSNPDATALAEKIITDQRDEIITMQAILDRL